MALFSTTGIRGIANDTFTPDFALSLARTYGSMLPIGAKVLIGNDPRTSSEMVKSAAIAALLETGVNVFDTGTVPIPVLNFAVRKHKYDAGIMITSSHNPPEYIGMKFILSNGMEISEADEKKFEKLFNSKKFRQVDWKKVGKYAEHNVIEDYIQAVLKSLKLKSLNLKVVLDIGNGAQGMVVPNLFKLLNCEIILLHSTMNGFFERGPEPRPENLTKLRETVLNENADLGVAFDTDGDRAIFVTDKGEILMGDVTGSLMAGKLLQEHKGGLVVTTVATSSLIDDVSQKHKGKIIKTKIGGKIVGDILIRKKALFGFEENGGCMFPEISPSRDGALTAVKVAELVSASKQTLSSHISALPKYFQQKARVECPDMYKNKLMNYISAHVKKESGETFGFATRKQSLRSAKIDRTDGVKILFDGSAWILIRPSGTEPIFRVFAESKSQKRTSELIEWGTKKVQEALSKLKAR